MPAFIERNPRQGVELRRMGDVGTPHCPCEPRAAWWIAPVCFLIVGAFEAAAMLLWFVRGAA